VLQINDDLSRSSAALACRRFRGTHSFDKIAQILDRIMSEYDVSYTKVVSTVTDNASNMVKCFKEFGITLPDDCSDDEEEESDEEDDDGESDEETISFPSIEKSVKLSSHFRCASHTLNLVARPKKYMI